MTDNLLPDNPGVPIQVMRGGGKGHKNRVAQKGGYNAKDIQILRKYHMGEGQELEEQIDEQTKQAFLQQRERCMKQSGTRTVLNKNCWAVSRVLRELLLRDIRAENSTTDVIRVHVKPQQSVAIHVIADDVEYEELEDDDEAPGGVSKGVGTDNSTANSNADSSNAASNADLDASNVASEASDPRRKSSSATMGDVSLDDIIPDLSGISDEDANRELELLEAASRAAAVEPAAPPNATIVENPLRAVTVATAAAPEPTPSPKVTVSSPNQAVVVPNPLQAITDADVAAPVDAPVQPPDQTIVVPNPLQAATAAVPEPEAAAAPIPTIIDNPLRAVTPKPNTRLVNFFKQQAAKKPLRTLESLLPANELRRLNQAHKAMTAKNRAPGRNNSAKNNKRIAPPPTPVRKPNSQTRRIVRNPLVNMGVVQARPAEPVNRRNSGTTKKASVLNTVRSALKKSRRSTRKNNRRR